MGSGLRWTFAGVIGVVGVAALLAAAPNAKPKTAWEYKFVSAGSLPSFDTADSPNALGADGWELVAVSGDASSQYVQYYKRPK